MTQHPPRHTDRVEAYIEAVDRYEPTHVREHEDAFRLFARSMSRSLDARYLERHPTEELLPDLEHLMVCSLRRQPRETNVSITTNDDGTQRGVLTLCVKDYPFLISTIRLALDAFQVRSFRSLSCVMPIRRDTTGEISAVGTNDGVDELVMWIEIEAENLSAQQADLQSEIRHRLDDTCAAVHDFPAIREQVQQLADQFETLGQTDSDEHTLHASNAEFLRWLLDDHFIFLGTRFIPLEGVSADTWASLGVATVDSQRTISPGKTERAIIDSGPLAPWLWLRKSQTESWTYRPGLTDRLLAYTHDAEGTPNGLLMFEGLFSFQALAEPKTNIPLLNVMLEKVFTQLHASRGSHRHRTIRNAFNSLPLEYLFSLDLNAVLDLVEQLLDVDKESRLQVHITKDDHQAYAFVFITLPRPHYSDELRADIRRLLQARFDARSVDGGVYAGGTESVAVHYFLTGTTSLDERSKEELVAEIDQLSRPWHERLNDELSQRFDKGHARNLHSLYCNAFPRRYREETSMARTVRDIELLEELHDEDRFNCDLYREKTDDRLGVTRLRLFQNQKLLLSDILPILDNLGLVVIDQYPTEVHIPGRPDSTIATFRLGGVQKMNLDLLSRRNRLTAAVRAALIEALDNDPMNRLLLRADIPWTYVVLMRSYQAYARQLGSPYGNQMVRDALERHADIVRALTELFRAKFDPNIEGLDSDEVCDQRLRLIDRARKTLLTLLDSVSNLTSDQILRQFLNLIEATLRTNFYVRAPLRQHEVVLKFDPAQIQRMPEPRPFREIYVHHPLVAGLHLRGGEIARGGIRWSDRRLDFRKEVLGLMATQNLKNVLIVPRGAKGAFIVRKVPADVKQLRATAEQAYRHFIKGILSITDNLVEGAPQTPAGIVCYDDKDHYLVVAADKGTAHLSDTANALAGEGDFWLGDAFASGGSKGYDHKVDGITAKGAWECVKRHFFEMGKDPERDPITAVGIGDMSGDVFGNGMLLSQSLQLVAAFDHRHVFIDPTPDPAKSYAARLELFNTPQTCWEDYPTDLISEGGGVYPRESKSIALSPEARNALGINDEHLSGQELIQCILRAPADLLWNGGIGTYIKADNESDLDVGDPANDPVRVNASGVRALVIGEGGNLGITSQGRIQLASQGVRLNTDALDNSAGVDLSDHEVNLKILLKQPLQDNTITMEERDSVLEEVRAEINQMCLNNNWVHSRMISLDQLRSRRDMSRFKRAITFLSQQVPFDRKPMHLPDDATLSHREELNEGLYRPELATLAANAKLHMRQALVDSPLFTLEALQDSLLAYFPQSIVERFEDAISTHPLGINIARTMLTNRIVGDAGATWLSELHMQTGRRSDHIIASYLQACQLLSADTLKAQISALETPLDAETEYSIRLIIEDAIEGVTNGILRSTNPVTENFAAGFNAVLELLPTLMPAEDLAKREAATDAMATYLPRALAERISMLNHYEEALDIARIVELVEQPVEHAGKALYTVGFKTNLISLIRESSASHSTSTLDKPARSALRDQLRSQLVGLAVNLLGRQSPHEPLNPGSQTLLDTVQQELAPLLRGGALELSALVMAVDRIGRHTDAPSAA